MSDTGCGSGSGSESGSGFKSGSGTACGSVSGFQVPGSGPGLCPGYES